MNNEIEMSVEDNFTLAFKEMQKQLFLTHIAKGWCVGANTTDVNWQGNQITLMHRELSEAHEAIRGDLMDDKITHRKGLEVELADTVIRIMNFGTQCGLDIAGALVEKAEFNKGRPYKHGDKKF